jgi:hypothetical protein
MSTVKIATFVGACPLCGIGVPKGTRIARTALGWAHEECAAEWKAARTGYLLTASGSTRLP